jgi:hypothetical protein
MRDHGSLHEKLKSLQCASVSLGFRLTDGKRDRVRQRWVHDEVVGIRHMHVRQHVAAIDQKTGRRAVARGCGVAGSRFIDTV